MTKILVSIIIAVIATLIIECPTSSAQPEGPNNGGAHAYAPAGASVYGNAAAQQPGIPPYGIATDDSANKLGKHLQLLTQSVVNEANAHPYLYDRNDIETFINDPSSHAAMQFLAQRSYNWRRAYRLAVDTLRWRAKMGVNQLVATQFPCDLFRLGLIFEHGNSHQRDANGAYVVGSPVIWIRLGAFGSVIKHLERLTPKRLISYSYNAARDAASKARNFLHRARHHNSPRVQSGRPPLVENLSIKTDATIMYVMKAIAWWLNDWERNHPNTRATLVLDFENTDFALSSWTTGEFLLGLDDHFPDLFDQIIGFRFKPKFWSFHSPISMFTRIFKSRITSSPETDKKLKFVRSDPQISSYMPRVDVEGFTMLPDHVSGVCNGPKLAPPAGCQEDTNALAASGLYDPELWQAIHNEFYQICRPRQRGI